MPHATEDEAPGPMDEASVMQQLLSGSMPMPIGDDPMNGREFDQTDKADNAIDYEDISDDDDLPEEEEATNVNGGGDEELHSFFDPIPDGLSSLPAQAQTNGVHDAKDGHGDLFGDAEDTNDLFGDRVSSPEELRLPQDLDEPQHRPGGLALPSKLGLALPGQPGTLQQYSQSVVPSPSSTSPPPFQDRDFIMSPASMATDDDDEEDNEDGDSLAALQRRMIRDSERRAKGEEVLTGPVETDMNTFHTLYPGYEGYQAPKFLELFPPRSVEYKGKIPIKPPKAVVPTKLSLDLLLDQERSFKAISSVNKAAQESTFNNSVVHIGHGTALDDDSDDDLALSALDENELVGGISMGDLALICEDWDLPGSDAVSFTDDSQAPEINLGGWDLEDAARPTKKRKIDVVGSHLSLNPYEPSLSLEDPERAVAKLAKSVALDLNDPHLLIDEHAPQKNKRKIRRVPGDVKRDAALSRDLAKRYNISNDQAYDLLKENHQHKVRSTLGSMAVEHSLPAVKLQFPFYRVGLDSRAKRAFHRPHLDLKQQFGREYRFQKPRHIKKKHWRGREAKEVYSKAEDLSFGDNATALLLEYSEEAPMMMSNFGMGNRLINYYRKRDAEDQERPKREIGETQVLLTQDKSPFANFGHVDRGEIVPTIQNGLYRAPIFQHPTKPTDFLIGVSSTWENGDRLFLRNVENLHIVGQQFPLAEVPGQHSRKVTDAAKKRLRALSYRIYAKSLERTDKVLDNHTLMPHLPGHDMPQTRSKMREFMNYEKATNRSETSGVWVPKPGNPVPDTETLRSWIRPEDVCLLDSMQVGVQHLTDLGISESKDADDDKDIDEGSNIEQQLAPWRATKNFLNACQGKAMLKLHGEGDPTGRGEGFSFVKTSMKGGFTAVGESVEDKLDARRRKENGGHSYNVAKQQKAYDESIRRIWDSQKASLTNELEVSDTEMDDVQEPESAYPYGRAATPRSSFGTPAAASRHEDDYASQISGLSASRGDKVLIITRKGGYDRFGRPQQDYVEKITNPRVVAMYKKRRLERQLERISMGNLAPTGNAELDALAREQLEKELARVQRNSDRRAAREKAKGKRSTGFAGSPSAADSPGLSDNDGQPSLSNPAGSIGTDAASTPNKKARGKESTARKCANCGQVGHIKTNRKSVFSTTVFFSRCPFCNASFTGSQPRGIMPESMQRTVSERGGKTGRSRNSRTVPTDDGGIVGQDTGSRLTNDDGADAPAVSFMDESFSAFLL